MIDKKVKCLHCGTICECNDKGCVRKCSCGKVSISGNIVTEGALGVDYVVVDAQLLIG